MSVMQPLPQDVAFFGCLPFIFIQQAFELLLNKNKKSPLQKDIKVRLQRTE